MPQSSRMIVTCCAWRSQRASSPRCWAGAEAVRQIALLTSSSIDRNGGPRGESETNRGTRVHLYRAAGDQIQIGAGCHPGGNRGVAAGGLVIGRDGAPAAAAK